MLILFQGDSITDGGRGRTSDPNHILGHSYPFLIAAMLGEKYPAREFSFINRGVSGDGAAQMYARWQSDTLSLSPDLISILIGTNDAYEEQQITAEGGIYIDRFEETYDLMLRQARARNPAVKLVLCEPFLLDSGNLGDGYPLRYEILESKRMCAERLAKRYDAVFIPLQKKFDHACARMTANYWIWDSVHPTYCGHGLIAKCWLSYASGLLGIDFHGVLDEDDI